MTALDSILELLARVGASNGSAVLVSEEELGQWPADAVKTMQAQGLLTKASPAVSVVCPGCEQQCTMPVHTLRADSRGPASSFIVCDKRDDINRVAVSVERLKQWQCSAVAIAALITRLLGLRSPDSGGSSPGRWEIGMLKGAKHSSHLLLSADGQLVLNLAGHLIDLADLLTVEDSAFKLDKQVLLRLVDKPIAGAGDKESAAQRRTRLKKRVQAEKNKGNKAFLKTVADEEGFSVSRLKQLLQEKHQLVKTGLRRSTF